jgi:hypothetical protein
MPIQVLQHTSGLVTSIYSSCVVRYFAATCPTTYRDPIETESNGICGNLKQIEKLEKMKLW